MARAPPRCSVSLYAMLPASRSGNTRTLARPATSLRRLALRSAICGTSAASAWRSPSTASFGARSRTISAARHTLSTRGWRALPCVENDSIATRGVTPRRRAALIDEAIAMSARVSASGSTLTAQSAKRSASPRPGGADEEEARRRRDALREPHGHQPRLDHPGRGLARSRHHGVRVAGPNRHRGEEEGPRDQPPRHPRVRLRATLDVARGVAVERGARRRGHDLEPFESDSGLGRGRFDVRAFADEHGSDDAPVVQAPRRADDSRVPAFGEGHRAAARPRALDESFDDVHGRLRSLLASRHISGAARARAPLPRVRDAGPQRILKPGRARWRHASRRRIEVPSRGGERNGATLSRSLAGGPHHLRGRRGTSTSRARDEPSTA